MARVSKAATLRGLSSRMLDRASRVGAAGENAKRVYAKHILKQLIFFQSPVDTSKLISNWRVAVVSPVMHEIPAYFPGKDRSTFSSSAMRAWRTGLAIINATSRPGLPIVISNVTDYVYELNRWKVVQVAPGFVERAVAIGSRNAALSIKAKGVF